MGARLDRKIILGSRRKEFWAIAAVHLEDGKMDKGKMLRSLVAGAMLASLILVSAACGEGAEPTSTPALSGAIEGVVTDADGRPVLGMRLAIVDGTAPFPEIAPVTDGNGVYRFPAIPPGTFSVAVHDEQGNRIALQSVEVRNGEASKLDFILAALR